MPGLYRHGQTFFNGQSSTLEAFYGIASSSSTIDAFGKNLDSSCNLALIQVFLKYLIIWLKSKLNVVNKSLATFSIISRAWLCAESGTTA